MGAHLQEAVRKLTRRKARGLGHWAVEQPLCLPSEAWLSMASMLNKLEEVG